MKPIIVILSITLLFLSSQLVAQVAINNSGSQPNSKAMLDVSSETSGMLIPRMTTAQRNTFEATLSATEQGMMVFDTESNTFYFYNGIAFDSISNGVIALLQDADGDTKIEVEETADQDVIRFSTAGTEYFAMGQGHLSVSNTGGSVFMGFAAGARDDFDNNRNVAIGYWTMYYTLTGKYNVALGNYSLFHNQTGHSNVAIGTNALYKSSDKSNLVAIGDSALYWNGDGATLSSHAIKNTAVGSKTLYANTTGSQNSAFGHRALMLNEEGTDNAAFGDNTLRSTTGSYNSGFGTHAMYLNESGAENTAVGSHAMLFSDSGNGNTAVGRSSMTSNSDGDENTAMGIESLFENESGHSNVAIGSYALREGIDIGYTVAVGDSALALNGGSSTIGTQAQFNTAVGSKSLKNNTLGAANTGLGFQSMYSNTLGYGNTALGKKALYENEDGDENTAVGTDALYNNTANANTAVGYQSLFANTSGYQNVALGSQSLVSNQGGDDNTAYGYASMLSNTSGNNNTAVGSRALNSSTGDANVAVGYRSLYSTTGHNNIALGYKAGDNLTSGSNNIIIGHDIDAWGTTSNNRLNIGNLIFAIGMDGSGTTSSSGNVGIGTFVPTEKLTVIGNTKLLNTSGEVNLYLSATSGHPEIQFQDGGSYLGAVGYSFASDYLYIYEGGSFVFKDGKMGVGIVDPLYKLHVDGDICPKSHKGGDLGKSGLAWNNIYYDDLYNQGAAAFTDRNVSSELLRYPPVAKNEGDFDYKTDRGLEELDPTSLPPALQEDYSILTDEMTTYNYKANYEQQQQIEQLKQMVEELAVENQAMKEKINQLENKVQTQNQ